jgi:hypothetical protein
MAGRGSRLGAAEQSFARLLSWRPLGQVRGRLTNSEALNATCRNDVRRAR